MVEIERGGRREGGKKAERKEGQKDYLGRRFGSFLSSVDTPPYNTAL